ncbi:ParA family protein [bacterium]|nr:MAG: ParA family protein [bacterium]
MKIIAVLNHKGGTGKTTSSLNIGAGLARLKKKTLLVDLDPQTNLTEGLGVRKVKESVYNSMKNGTDLPIKNISEYLDLVPSSIDLLGAELQLVSRSGRETILKDLLDKVKNQYEYIIIDCPPALGMLTINALVSSDTLLIPLEAEFYSYRGIDRMILFIKEVRTHYNKKLTIGGVFITKCNHRRLLTDQITENVKKHFKNKLLDTTIRVNVSLAEAPVQGKNIFEYAPTSNGAIDYGKLVDEILIKI